MEQETIKSAFNRRLLDLPNKLHIVFDNEPVEIAEMFPYIRAVLVPVVIENYRDMGFYQVTISYFGMSSDLTEMEVMIKKIEDHFYRGFIFIEGDEKIIIERHPESSPKYKNNKRLDITIRIRYYCY